MINSNIDDLTPNFRDKVKLFLQEAKERWFNIKVFEWKRSKERQQDLYNQGRTTPWKIVTWTMKSKHLDWNAVDLVFLDKNWNPSWVWDYNSLISIWKKYWMNNLAPTETCHFEDNWKPILPVINSNMSKNNYTEILADLQKTSWLSPIFSSFEWDTPILEKEVKQLIEIWGMKFRQKNWLK